jgi:hypothetical protein
MSTLILAFLASVSPDLSLRDIRAELITPRIQKQESQTAEPKDGRGRMTLHKDGGPGAGPDQPYNVRENGATDLQDFAGGRQVVFVEPYDIFFLLALVGLVVLLIIIL